MKGYLAVSAALTLGMLSVANAQPPRATYRWTDPSRMGGTWAVPTPDTVSHVIFLNRCSGGCTIHPGNDDSLSDTSSIPNRTSVVSEYSGSSSQWQQIVNCVKQTYAPFDVTITDVRPSSGDYHEAIVAGYAADVGMEQGVLGVSPFSCGYIPNSISFSFADEEPSNIMDLCWTVSQETAHSWGLDHKYDNRDPMTYLSSGPDMKTFQNQAGSCGEYSARQCSCSYDGTGSSAMNAYALVMATFGSSTPDTVSPTVTITGPNAGAVVNPGFAIHADVTDDRIVDHVELKIDGQSVGTVTAAPYLWNAPSSLSGTTHHLEVDGYDAAGNMGTAAIDVLFPQSCHHDTDCSSGQLCSNGQCVAGPGTAGGLGSTCTANSDCASNQCAGDGTHQYCVDSCTPTASTCPGHFSCVDTGGGNGVCWPGADAGGGGGGCNAGGGSAPMLVGLGFAALLITRRRKR